MGEDDLLSPAVLKAADISLPTATFNSHRQDLHFQLLVAEKSVSNAYHTGASARLFHTSQISVRRALQQTHLPGFPPMHIGTGIS